MTSTTLALPAVTVRTAIDPDLTSSGRPIDARLSTAIFAVGLKADQKTTELAPSQSAVKPLEKLPHRLQTAADHSDSESLTRQTSLGQSSGVATPLSPTADGATNTPARGRLPSISELIANPDPRHFSNTASPTVTSQPRPQPQYTLHRPSRSVGSAGHPSPLLVPHTTATSQISSAVYANYPAYSPNMLARSPTNGASDGPYYGAPQYYSSTSPFLHRRTSAASDRGVAIPPSLNATSSSGDSSGTNSSGADSYSTSNTTPIDSSSGPDNVPRINMMLPPPPAMMLGSFRCTYDGCNAPPFQTQYLLTSHKNVHSQNRPHYCPVKNCSRSEGGKGFKRKNEMIRHGLVHNSPGYICPFCPEREHKYPRPDNLQRHVRVHHVDKHRDDPALQEVLNQRTEGQGKTRRKRTLTNSPTAV